MINPAKQFVTPEEYLALEEKADHKSEYCDGEIFALGRVGQPQSNCD
jgi:Uma2 family endonuclease